MFAQFLQNEIIPRSVPILYGLLIILFLFLPDYLQKSILILNNSNKTKNIDLWRW